MLNFLFLLASRKKGGSEQTSTNQLRDALDVISIGCLFPLGDMFTLKPCNAHLELRKEIISLLHTQKDTLSTFCSSFAYFACAKPLDYFAF